MLHVSKGVIIGMVVRVAAEDAFQYSDRTSESLTMSLVRVTQIQ